ncbi:MAG TPA: DUF438 domain-containing protein [Elusimicrobiales bacterium]|nr:DUF438 domain-containing protein [Elusimicrobiales bacterium]HOL62332.1 DUF438 domain-containing protein [Elusimicrobiales bacterium]
MGGVNKKEVVKEILKKLNSGISFQEAKKEVVAKIGNIESKELFEIEQELINEGITPEEIKRFCNVHALLFEGMFENKISDIKNPSHPVNLFKAENEEIAKRAKNIKEAIEKKDFKSIKKLLADLNEIKLHYEKKEQILFPYLEKQNLFGPSKVMWGKDNEIRELYKNAIENFLEKEEYIEKHLKPLIDEIEGMIFKEENILFPTSLEKLSTSDWVEIFKQMSHTGFCYITPPKESFEAEDIDKKIKKTYFENGYINFPTGKLKLEEITQILNTLPIDITFIDKNELVKYFSDSKERIFLRTSSIIGREVRNCHPPQSLKAVEKVINDLKNGIKKYHDFWITIKGRLIYIRYFPVKDEFDNFLGILEVTQDITNIKKIEGQKRLVE